MVIKLKNLANIYAAKYYDTSEIAERRYLICKMEEEH